MKEGSIWKMRKKESRFKMGNKCKKGKKKVNGRQERKKERKNANVKWEIRKVN